MNIISAQNNTTCKSRERSCTRCCVWDKNPSSLNGCHGGDCLFSFSLTAQHTAATWEARNNPPSPSHGFCRSEVRISGSELQKADVKVDIWLCAHLAAGIGKGPPASSSGPWWTPSPGSCRTYESLCFFKAREGRESAQLLRRLSHFREGPNLPSKDSL